MYVPHQSPSWIFLPTIWFLKLTINYLLFSPKSCQFLVVQICFKKRVILSMIFCRVGLRTDQTTPKMNFYTHCCLLLASSKNMLQCNLSKDQIEFSGKICRVQFNFELKFTYIMKVPLAPLYNKSKKKWLERVFACLDHLAT